MNAILIYLVEASICVAITVLFYRFVLSELTFFTLNRVLLIGMLMLSFVIPMLSFNVGITSIGTGEILLPEFLVGKEVAQESVSFSWQEIVFYTYLAGVVVMTVHLILGFLTSQRLLGKSRLMRYQNYWIAVHPKFIPASFFSYILLPDFDPNRSEQKQIVLHESIHVRLKHSWDLLLIQFAKIIFWFNPLIYQFERSLREVHEYQADQGVTSTYSKKEYSGLLLQMITGGQGWHFMNNFNQFQTKKRIIMMSKPQSQKKEMRRFLLAIPVMAALFFVFSCEITPEEDIEGPTMMGESAAPKIGPTDITARKMAKDGEVIFDVVEEQPNPPGDMEGWNNYLKNNLRYPAEARRLGVEGTVIVVFVVNTDGSLSDIEILRGIGGGADEEVVRIIENAPDWNPGKQHGTVVNTRMRLPVRFKLD
ncbi:M56 family metallopeptidase [Algoriphagus antarcticus]|uniref:Outer membrane transport energization protein TonB n=1 Tax=Algoriphagus antarcticus TaxID=238540 RepID=A0A3E0DVH8_9BACT|nr:M56 family metallopeptidase [Algoriphagus antarcticus]REG88622.1 outer membrane transport energization protein TonB [Algoriphagus antarcticus]